MNDLLLLDLIPRLMAEADRERPVASMNDSRSRLINDLSVLISSSSSSCGKRLGNDLLASRVVWSIRLCSFAMRISITVCSITAAANIRLIYSFN